jgi:hypothetical protein
MLLIAPSRIAAPTSVEVIDLATENVVQRPLRSKPRP